MKVINIDFKNKTFETDNGETFPLLFDVEESITLEEFQELVDKSENAISEMVCGKFFRCIKPFLSWMKKGESYWLEYHGNNKYEVRSDNNLGKNFEMAVHQLLTCFVPCDCERDELLAIKYFHWLGELRVHHGYIDDYVAYKEHLYKKIAMLDCHTCINFNKECEPYNNVFKCNYPLKTSSKELKNN